MTTQTSTLSLVQRIKLCLDEWEATARAAMRPSDAIPGGDSPDITTWGAYFNYHADPFVGEVVDRENRRGFGMVAQIGTGPADYGRARALFIGEWDPARAMAIITFGRQLLEIHCVRGELEAGQQIAAGGCQTCSGFHMIHGPDLDGKPREIRCFTLIYLAGMLSIEL